MVFEHWVWYTACNPRLACGQFYLLSTTLEASTFLQEGPTARNFPYSWTGSSLTQCCLLISQKADSKRYSIHIHIWFYKHLFVLVLFFKYKKCSQELCFMFPGAITACSKKRSGAVIMNSKSHHDFIDKRAQKYKNENFIKRKSKIKKKGNSMGQKF